MRKPLLGAGFVLSAITDFALLLTALFFPMVFNLAFGTFPLSIILRGIGWIRLGKESKFRLFVATGSAVLVLGLIFYVSLMVAKELSLSIALWIVYSMMELLSYIKVNRALGNRLIIFACISIIGIATTALITLPKPTALGLETLSPLRYALIFLLSSSIIAAISFLKK